jgi:putative endonuclease
VRPIGFKNWIPASAGMTEVRVIGGIMKDPSVYILASNRNGTLYIGVTSDPIQRIWDHKHDTLEGFTKRYGIHMLVYIESHDAMSDAITREKQLKKWNRAWKLKLIEDKNPNWEDLYDTLI